MSNEDRAKHAYAIFRGGFRKDECPVPHWDDAPSWVRDMALICYMQGKLDYQHPGPQQS